MNTFKSCRYWYRCIAIRNTHTQNPINLLNSNETNKFIKNYIKKIIENFFSFIWYKKREKNFNKRKIPLENNQIPDSI